MEIVKAGVQHIDLINDLAARVWEPTYRDILSAEQLSYMFDMMYSNDAIHEQLSKKGHKFLLAKEDKAFLGFASFELNYKPQTTKIHKLYVMPGEQGRGIGYFLEQAIAREAVNAGNSIITLNVNRYNSAISFYIRAGYLKAGEEDIHIGNGYLMEDYIMEKILHTL